MNQATSQGCTALLSRRDGGTPLRFELRKRRNSGSGEPEIVARFLAVVLSGQVAQTTTATARAGQADAT